MYTEHFGLKKLPFENVPDPIFFFDQGDHHRVRYRVEESLKAGRGLTVVTGHIGSGKTTISQMIQSDLSDQLISIWIAEPPGTSTELFMFIAQELDLKPSSSEKTFVLRDIRDALLKINSEGNKCLVIIDEGHLMSDDTINGIRLLNNLEEGATKLIQLLLLGQEELMEIINRPEMEPFKQRIATLEMLGKMDTERIREYISHRIKVAGGQHTIFSDTGWEALNLAFGSGSTPRVINSLCDRACSVALERQKSAVDVDDVYEAAESMGVQKEIFFYKIKLREREEKQQVPPTKENNSIKESETGSKSPSQIFKETPYTANTKQKVGQTETPELFRMEADTGSASKKGLKVPIIILFVSVVLLILSIFFYCQKSASPDVMGCLQELIGF
jgi:general secretion pathway protein A